MNKIDLLRKLQGGDEIEESYGDRAVLMSREELHFLETLVKIYLAFEGLMPRRT